MEKTRMLDRLPRYRKLNTYLKQRFGERVYRVGLCGGFTCPNRDGTLGWGGCTFCNPESSRPRGHVPGTPVTRQLEAGIRYVGRRHRAERFIAYFSDYTATHAPTEVLRGLYEPPASDPRVVGLAVGTRPDCLDAAVLDLFEELAQRTWLTVELGVQTARDETLARVRRGHTAADSRRAIRELHLRGISATAHVILGLPGETLEDGLETARFLRELGVEGVKIHGLHVVDGTELADEYRRGQLSVLSLNEYVAMTVAFLEHMPSRTVVHRLTGEAPRRLTLAPQWSVNKLAVVNAIEQRLEELDTWQGRSLGEARPAPAAEQGRRHPTGAHHR